uniref:Uncharacterized protein n=1 Tax=Cacopsylla melanoneura TaxID=428564 RepID=A0A8D9BEL4_9HEMI
MQFLFLLTSPIQLYIPLICPPPPPPISSSSQPQPSAPLCPSPPPITSSSQPQPYPLLCSLFLPLYPSVLLFLVYGTEYQQNIALSPPVAHQLNADEYCKVCSLYVTLYLVSYVNYLPLIVGKDPEVPNLDVMAGSVY